MDACPEPGIVLLAHMDDHRLVDFRGKLELLLQDLALVGLFFGFLDPVIIQSNLTDGDDLFMESRRFGCWISGSKPPGS